MVDDDCDCLSNTPNTGLIVGVVLTILFVILCAICIFFLIRRAKKNKAVEKSVGTSYEMKVETPKENVILPVS